MFRRSTQTVEKPSVIADYNKYMLGVDKLDQLVSYYSFLHKSVKWWRKVFFWLLEVSVVNSYVIYKEDCTTNGIAPKSHLAYRRILVTELTNSFCETSTARARTLSRTRVTPTPHRLQQTPHFLLKAEKRVDCFVCSKRAGQRHLTYYRCETCPDNPALCPTECFKLYHTRSELGN